MAEVSAGAEFTCARLDDGQVRCWGYNAFGQLGDGGTADSTRPVVVLATSGRSPLTGATRLSSGWSHSCVVVSGGQIRCWGDNSQGQLGDGTTTDRLRPVAVRTPSGTANLTGIAEVSAGGYFTCARKTNGQARCWGSNFYGQLGNGTTTDSTRPVTVSNLTGGNALQGVKKISAGRWHACARLENGQSRCWGDNEDGQLGDGTTTNRTRPVSVSNATGGNALQNVRKISAGTWQTCAKLSNGQARCWGDNAFGALGDGTVTDRLRPVTVSNEDGTGALSVVGIISAGEYRHSCAVLDGDQARCWGYNFTGQLGDGTTTNRTRPVVVLPAG